jgi:hypothetical protein
MDHTPRVFLPYSDGTKGVFCEMSYRRVRPCNGRVTLNSDGIVITGYVVYTNQGTRFLCTPKCLSAYALRAQMAQE